MESDNDCNNESLDINTYILEKKQKIKHLLEKDVDENSDIKKNVQSNNINRIKLVKQKSTSCIKGNNIIINNQNIFNISQNKPKLKSMSVNKKTTHEINQELAVNYNNIRKKILHTNLNNDKEVLSILLALNQLLNKISTGTSSHIENPGKTNIIDNLKKEYEYLLFKRDQLSQYDYVDSLTKQLDEIKKEISMKEYGIKYLKVNNLMNEKRIFQIKTNTPNITDYSKQLIDYKTKNDYYQKLIDKNSIIIESNYKVIEIKQKKLNKIKEEFFLL